MRAMTALVCVLFVALSTALPVAAVGEDTALAGTSEAAVQPATVESTQEPGDERTVHLDVQLLTSGDADWTVTTYVPLDGDNETSAFRDLGRRYANGTADVAIDAGLFRRYVAAARSASGRSMTIPRESVERSWAVENGTGVLRLQFTWTDFAREEQSRYVVDDAFRTNSGTWLPRLEEGQVLVVRPPEGVGFVETPKGKGVTDGALRWEGPQTLGPDYFYIEYRSGDDGTPSGTPSQSPETPSGTPGGPLPSQAYLLLAVLLGSVTVAYLWVRRERASDGVPRPGSDVPAGDAVTDGSTGVADGQSAGQDAPADVPAEPTPDDPFAGVDVEMLSDEERVLRLLDANGGRMKQARIVKETDWSNAKVSQLLSSMAEGGEIDKLRIGRENLISLPDVDVDSFDE